MIRLVVAKRPPWWRPFARRRWDRAFIVALEQMIAAANQGEDGVMLMDQSGRVHRAKQRAVN